MEVSVSDECELVRLIVLRVIVYRGLTVVNKAIEGQLLQPNQRRLRTSLNSRCQLLMVMF